MPYLVPYGGPSWTVACLLPPSSISLFASVLLKMEVCARLHQNTVTGLSMQQIQTGTQVHPHSSCICCGCFARLLLWNSRLLLFPFCRWGSRG